MDFIQVLPRVETVRQSILALQRVNMRTSFHYPGPCRACTNARFVIYPFDVFGMNCSIPRNIAAATLGDFGLIGGAYNP